MDNRYCHFCIYILYILTFPQAQPYLVKPENTRLQFVFSSFRSQDNLFNDNYGSSQSPLQKWKIRRRLLQKILYNLPVYFFSSNKTVCFFACVIFALFSQSARNTSQTSSSQYCTDCFWIGAMLRWGSQNCLFRVILPCIKMSRQIGF